MKTSLDLPPISVAALEKDKGQELRELARRLRADGYCELLLGGSLPAATMDGLSDEMRVFFAQPMARKRAVALDKHAGLRGYVGMGEEATNGIPDRKESFEFTRESTRVSLVAPYDVLAAPNVWPDPACLPQFRAVMERYNEAMVRLGAVVFGAMTAALATSETRKSCAALMEGQPCYYSRLIRYPKTDGSRKTRDPLVDHTDHSFFTIGYQTAPGLEIRTSDGAWQSWPWRNDRLMVFTGEIASIWSGALYRSAPHRVRNSLVTQERFAVTTFVLPDLEAEIIPLTEDGSKLDTDRSPYRLLDEEFKRMTEIFSGGREEMQVL